MSEHWTDRLSEYLDDELEPAERRAAEAHLAECDACAGTLEELRAVVARARTLDDRPPERDLWPGIASRMTPREGATVVDLDEERHRRRRARRFSFTAAQLVASAAALVVLSGGGVWWAMAGSGPGPGGDAVAVGSSAAVGLGGPAGRFATTRYDAAVRELERTLETRREALDPATVDVVERNLEIIDRAIADARGALEEDPSSPYLNAHLARAMKRKFEILRRATTLAGASL